MKGNILTIVFTMLCAVSFSQTAHEYVKLINTGYMGIDKHSFHDLSDYGIFEDGRMIDTIKTIYYNFPFGETEPKRLGIFEYTMYRESDTSYVTTYYNDSFENRRGWERYVTKRLLPDGSVRLHIWSTAEERHYLYKFDRKGRIVGMMESEGNVFSEDVPLIPSDESEIPNQPYDVTKDKNGIVKAFVYDLEPHTISYTKNGLIERTYNTNIVGNTFYMFNTHITKSYKYSDFTDAGSWRRCDVYSIWKGKEPKLEGYFIREIITH